MGKTEILVLNKTSIKIFYNKVIHKIVTETPQTPTYTNYIFTNSTALG